MAKMDTKIAVLMKIREFKHILFGAFSDTLTKENKVDEWKKICEFGKALGLIPKEKDFSYARDVFWSNIKRATLAKKDNAKKTGTGGGKAKKMSPLDDIVLEIIGEDSPILEGLGMRDTMTSSSQNIEAKTEEVDVSIPSPNIKPSCSTQKTEVDASPQNIRQVNSNKKYKRFVTSQSKSHEDHLDLQSLKKRKLQAQLEFLDLQNYKTKLEIYEMEERLNIPHSDVTKILKD